VPAEAFREGGPPTIVAGLRRQLGRPIPLPDKPRDCRERRQHRRDVAGVARKLEGGLGGGHLRRVGRGRHRTLLIRPGGSVRLPGCNFLTRQKKSPARPG
jgi:hypothetical protein